jgi:uncharacterized protein (TIGR02147 family)
MKNWDREFIDYLFKCTDHVSFLQGFFKFQETPNWQNPRPLSLQEFSLRAGYKTKSYIHEILHHKKKLPPTSVEKIAKGLKLNKWWSEYFKTLYERDTELSDHKNLTLKLKAIAQKIEINTSRLAKNSSSPTIDSLKDLYKNKFFPEVFASLGSPEKGASLIEMMNRTKLKNETILTVLDLMLKEKIVHQKNERYFLDQSFLDLDYINTQDYFILDFKRSVEKMYQRLEKQVQNEDALFMVQTFSIKQKSIPLLREKIAELIIEHAEEFEDPEGDAIAEICIGLTKSI